jgi:hypothetical protein
MTVSTDLNTVAYTGNGATTVFPFTFTVLAEEDLFVYERVIATGVNTLLDASEYSVTGVPGPGSITYNPSGVPLPSTKKLIILREVSLTQDMDIENQGGFFPEVLEDQLDKIVMGLQQVAEEIGRAIVTSPGGTGVDADEYLAAIAAQAAAAAVSAAAAAQTVSDASDQVPLAAAQVALAAAQVVLAEAQTALAATARDAARDWASEAEDVPVDDGVNDPGYSAFHWAEKAAESAASLTFDGMTFTPAGTATVLRSVRERMQEGYSLLDFIPGNLHAGIKDASNATALTTYIQAAFDSGEKLTGPIGTFLIDGPVDVNLPVKFSGAGRGKSIFRLPDLDLNGIAIRSDDCSLSGFTVDLVNADDTASGSCVLIFTSSRCRLDDIEALNANRQGFTSQEATHNKLTNLFARNCGHRGVNFSQFSDHNIFQNIHTIDCGLSGFILGYGSSHNIVSNLNIDGFATSPGLLLDTACDGNIFSNVLIDNPAVDALPHMQVGIGCQDNIFTNAQLRNVTDRAILVRNENVDAPAGPLGIVNRPNARNIFRGFKIFGDAVAGTHGVLMDELTGAHGNSDHEFHDFYIDGVQHGVRDTSSTALNCVFNNFKFGTVTGRKWYMPTAKGHRVSNYPGVNYVGALASATAELPAQPTYTDDLIITNDFPFAVQINVSGQTGTSGGGVAAGTLINGASVSLSGGNGSFNLGPGQTIECRQGAGTGAWRWFALN